VGRELIAGDEAAGVRLDRYLADFAALPSRAAAERLIERGAVRVDGERATKSLRLAGGELIELDDEPEAAPAGPEPGAELELPLAFSDEHVIVVDKPAGVVTHPAPGVVGPTLVGALRGLGLRGGDDEQRPGVIHRLDRDTSGLLVLTRSDEAFAALGEQMRERRIEREYIALVRGRPPSRKGTIDAPIGRDRHDVGRMAVGGRAERPAVTHFELAQPLKGASLLRLRLETGGRTRSACTWPRSGIRSSATRPMASPATRSGCGASSCTPAAWPSRIPSTAGASSSRASFRPISPPRSSSPRPTPEAAPVPAAGRARALRESLSGGPSGRQHRDRRDRRGG